MDKDLRRSKISALIEKSRPPVKPFNLQMRPREYLMEHEVEALRKVARAGLSKKHAHRDDTLILIMFRHALRVGEAIALRWSQIDFKLGIMHVIRLKRGTPSTHPLRGPELRALRRLKRDLPESPYVFNTERQSPLCARSVHNIIAKAAKKADFPFTVHPHMLRHSCGYYLANKGMDTRSIQAYMGHRCLNMTVLYTQLAPDRFDKFWED